MKTYNFLKAPLNPSRIHEGKGLCPRANIIPGEDFQVPIRFLNYSTLPSGASIGLHKHGDDNELYIILEGEGHYTMNGETVPVCAGSVCKSVPFCTHALENDGENGTLMRVLVIEGYNS